MDTETKSLWIAIQKGEVDINNQQLFFSIVAKGFIYKLNQNLKLRGINIPHYILNTGDDIMYLEVKGQDHSVEPIEVSNEDFIYSQIPRCMIQPTGMDIQMDQLSNPYSYGKFEIEHGDMIHSFRAEFRRIPVTYGFSLKYYLDNFTDSLDVIQQIISNLSFVNLFKVIYLGQQINCSYQIPDSYQTEHMVEFDGITTDSKYRTISLELAVSTNIPVIHKETVIPSDMIIKKALLGVFEKSQENNDPDNSGGGSSGSGGGNSGIDSDFTGSGSGNVGSGSGNNGSGSGNASSGGGNIGSGGDLIQTDTMKFRHGIILHSKGELYTSGGEISGE